MKRSRRWLLGLFAVVASFVLGACGDNTNSGSQPSGKGTVTGYVYDEENVPVVGAVLTIGGVGGKSVAGGAYTISGVPAGRQHVTAAATGYTFPSSIYVTVVADNTVSQNIIGTRSSQAPTLSVTALPGSLTFAGGNTVLRATAADPEGDALTVTAVYSGGTVTLVKQSDGVTYAATVSLPANATTTTKTYTFAVSVTDGQNVVSDSVDVTVAALAGPPTPNIR